VTTYQAAAGHTYTYKIRARGRAGSRSPFVKVKIMIP